MARKVTVTYRNDEDEMVTLDGDVEDRELVAIVKLVADELTLEEL